MKQARSALAAVLVATIAGCGEQPQSPTPPAISQDPLNAATAAAAPLAFRQLSAGSRHTCGVTTDNRAYCWGAGYNGQLGDGSSGAIKTAPAAVAGGLRFLQLSAGHEYTCGVTTDFKAYCWGENAFGKLGVGGTSRRLTPTLVLGGHRFRQVEAGVFHTCALTTADAAYCWGVNTHGRLGTGETYNKSVRPVSVAGGLLFRRLNAAGTHTCGFSDENVAYCWGQNASGQLGTASTIDGWTPKRVIARLRFGQIAAGSATFSNTGHSCAVTTDNRAFCWGQNDEGQLGNGFTNQALRPTAVAGGLEFAGVSAADRHSCGVTTGHRAYCWGFNGSGQLGDGNSGDTAPTRLSPHPVSGGLFFTAVTAGESHSCGVASGGQAYCWGSNGDGRLGIGSENQDPKSVPTAVAAPE